MTGQEAVGIETEVDDMSREAKVRKETQCLKSIGFIHSFPKGGTT